MKKGLLLLLLVALGAYGSFAQDTTVAPRKGLPTDYGTVKVSNQPLYIIDGVAIDKDSLKEINPKDIVLMNVFKGVSATALYGSIGGANGVIQITTRKAAIETYHKNIGAASEAYALKVSTIQDENEILYVVNGKPLLKNFEGDLCQINTEQILNVTLLDAAAAKAKYGVEKKEGAVVITKKELKGKC